MQILNLGAGDRIIAGAVNHDRVKHRPEIDVVWDLDLLPWPWMDNTFDNIEAVAILEHLKLTLIESLNECWRIIQPNGVLVVKYPIYTSVNIHDDPTHRWFWSAKAIDYVDPSTEYGHIYQFYNVRPWQIRSKGIIKERNLRAELAPIK